MPVRDVVGEEVRVTLDRIVLRTPEIDPPALPNDDVPLVLGDDPEPARVSFRVTLDFMVFAPPEPARVSFLGGGPTRCEGGRVSTEPSPLPPPLSLLLGGGPTRCEGGRVSMLRLGGRAMLPGPTRCDGGRVSVESSSRRIVPLV